MVDNKISFKDAITKQTQAEILKILEKYINEPIIFVGKDLDNVRICSFSAFDNEIKGIKISGCNLREEPQSIFKLTSLKLYH